MTRDEVLKEFYATPSVPGGATDRMADEIVSLRKRVVTITSMLWEQVPLLNRLEDENVRLLATLAKLREPSEEVLAVVCAEMGTITDSYLPTSATVLLRDAVAAAEREVAGDNV